jgi:hypothetical protein
LIGDITHLAIDGLLLGATLTPLGNPVPAGCVVIKLEIILCNFDATVAYKAEIQFIESGGTAGSAKKVIAHSSLNSMSAGESRSYTYNPMLAAGATIQGKADTANKISFRAAMTLKQVA